MANTSWNPQPQVAMTINDVRTLSVCLVRPADDLFYNWTTTGWEAPFVAANHLKPLQNMEAAPSLFSTVQYLNLGAVFLERTDLAALVVSMNNGIPVAVVDCWTLPTPTPNPVIGGFFR